MTFPTQLEDEYKLLQEPAVKELDKIVRRLTSLIRDNQIALSHPVMSRVKSWTSVQEKIERLKFDLTTLKSLDDLLGVRVITLLSRDVEKVGSLIEVNFDVKKKTLSTRRNDVDQFGYGSDHYVLALPEGLKAEIQLRTLAQHIWAEASHQLYYKREASVPRELRRAIHRVSALLETVDQELERLRNEKDEFVRKHSDESIQKHGDPFALRDDEGIYKIAVHLVLHESLPEKNFNEYDDYFGLLTELLHLKVDTIGKLRQLISEYLPYALEMEREAIKKRLNDPSVSDEEKIRLQETEVYCTQVALVRTMLMEKFGTDYRVFDAAKVAKEIREAKKV